MLRVSTAGSDWVIGNNLSNIHFIFQVQEGYLEKQYNMKWHADWGYNKNNISDPKRFWSGSYNDKSNPKQLHPLSILILLWRHE